MTMLSKETFIKTINFIQDRADAQHKISRYFSEEFGDSIFWPYQKYESTLVELLKEIFDDKETEWIDYFIYELDFGRKWQPFTVYEKDIEGNKVEMPLKNASNLYDVLTRKER